MYAQITLIHAPMAQMPHLRAFIEDNYLSVVRSRPGFRAGYLLEQIDDPDIAQLVLFWDNQASVENFSRTGLLQSSISILASEVPGVQVRRQSYIVKVATRAMPAAEAFT